MCDTQCVECRRRFWEKARIFGLAVALVSVLALMAFTGCKASDEPAPAVAGPSAMPTPDTCACDHIDFRVVGASPDNVFPPRVYVRAEATMLNEFGATLDAACQWTRAFQFDPPAGNGCIATGNAASSVRSISCIYAGPVTLTAHATLNGRTCWGRWDGVVSSD
jgi:hypothetical protein